MTDIWFLWELSDNEMPMEEDSDSNEDDGDQLSLAMATPVDSQKPWLKDFNYYINMLDQLADQQTIVQWWGVSHSWYYDQTWKKKKLI